jgi:hypothetical protein
LPGVSCRAARVECIVSVEGCIIAREIADFFLFFRIDGISI